MPVNSRSLRFDECELRICLSAVSANADPVIAFSTELTDDNGSELTKDSSGRYIVTPDSSIRLNVYADDLRGVATAGGVFSGYVNAISQVSTSQLSFIDGITYGPGFDLGQTGTVQSGQLLGVGALRSSLTPPGGDQRQLLFSVGAQLTGALSSGNIVTIDLASGEDPPTKENLVFGSPDEAPGSYTGTQLIVVTHPWQNSQDAADVDGNGKITTRDVLIIVNRLLRTGDSELGLPTISSHPPFFYDAVADGTCSLDDLQFVMDRILALRSQSLPSAAEPSLTTAPLGDTVGVVSELADVAFAETVPAAATVTPTNTVDQADGCPASTAAPALSQLQARSNVTASALLTRTPNQDNASDFVGLTLSDDWWN